MSKLKFQSSFDSYDFTDKLKNFSFNCGKCDSNNTVLALHWAYADMFVIDADCEDCGHSENLHI